MTFATKFTFPNPSAAFQETARNLYRQDSGCDTFLFVCETEKGGKKKNFFLLTSQSPSNSGGPISRQSCYYASFSPPHEDLESWWLTRRVGEKAFCSSRYVERDALLFHPHRKKKKKVFRCVCVCQRVLELKRILLTSCYSTVYIYIQLIPPLFSMTKYNIPKHAKVMKYIQTRLHHLLIVVGKLLEKSLQPHQCTARYVWKRFRVQTATADGWSWNVNSV